MNPNIQNPTTDDSVIEAWLQGRPLASEKTYRLEADHFRAFIQKPLAMITANDIQAYAHSLCTYARNTQSTRISIVKSLINYAHYAGHIPSNMARLVRVPRAKDTLAERFLEESEVQAMIAVTVSVRDRILLRLFYYSGCRLAEVVGLTWRDLIPSPYGGQITVVGKSQRTRAVRLPATMFQELYSLRGDAGPDDPVFVSRHSQPLSRRQVQRIVRAAGERAGIEGQVSPHWLRHSHATHALYNGAPIHEVAHTLGHTSLSGTSRYLHVRPASSSADYLLTDTESR